MFRYPKVQLTLILLIVFVTGLGDYPLLVSLRLLTLSIGFTALSDLVFTWIRKRQLFVPYSAFTTGLIITLLINPLASWPYIATVAAIAMAGKNFLRISNRHIFNPAGLGLFVGSILFNQPVTWWAVSFQSLTQFHFKNLLAFIILLLPLFISGYRLRRYIASFTFLLTFAILAQILNLTFSLTAFFNTLFDPTSVFFAIVMLPEPQTSPGKLKLQFWYGLTIAAIIYIFTLSGLSQFLNNLELLPDILILALLIGNLSFFKLR